MKLLVDINIKTYEAIKSPLDCCGRYNNECYNAIWNGKPLKQDDTYIQGYNDALNEIREEIIGMRSRENVGMLKCLDIINKCKSEVNE